LIFIKKTTSSEYKKPHGTNTEERYRGQVIKKKEKKEAWKKRPGEEKKPDRDQYEALIEVPDKKADLKKRFSVRVYVVVGWGIWRVRAKGTL
jgi:hypothetical protein